MAIGLDNIPRFTVDQLARSGDCLRAVGKLDRLARLSIGRAHLYVGDDVLISGDVVELQNDPQFQTDGFAAIFETGDAHAGDLLQEGQTYSIFDGYWGERAELVLDGTRNWQRRSFEPSTGIWNPVSGVLKKATQRTEDPKESLKSGAWDHEHCAICWTTISRAERELHEGYVDQNGVWVCVSCFETYVAPKSLAFPIDD